MTLRIGLVGGGTVAALHHAAAARCRDVEIVALCEPNAPLRRSRSAEWKLSAYDTLDALLASSDADALIIATSHDAHTDAATAALRSGRHVLVEKPVDNAAERIRVIAAVAAERRLVAMPGHNYAYLPEARRVIESARDGRLGHCRAAFITYAIAHSESLAARYGSALEEIMVHHAYLSLAAFGLPITISAGESSPAWASLSTSDQAWMTWQYETDGKPGLSAHLFASLGVDDLSDSPQSVSMKVLGSEGSSSFTWRSTTSVPRGGPFSVGLPLYEETFVHQLVAFRDAIAGDEAAILSTMEDAAIVADLMSAAREAVRTRASVVIAAR